MTANLIQPVIEQLRTAEALRVGSGRSDGELLEEYLRHRQEAALEALVRRHGPMVWGVCRRTLNCHHDAEDAFQATFLVLVRKAASVRPREQVGPWLFGVARQTARKARAAAAKRRVREQPAGPEPAAGEPKPVNEIDGVLDEQLSRLPWKYRAAIVLCDLEGKTRQEAARQLGVPEGTVAGRLARARTMLGRLLSRRGIGSAAAAALAPGVLPAPVVAQTIQVALLDAAGPAAAGAIAPPVLALTQGVLNAMYMSHAKMIAGALLAVAVTVGGASWGLSAMQAANNPPVPGAAAATAEEPKEKAKADLPKGLAPMQVLASVDKDGKLVIKTRPAIENLAFAGGAIIINGLPGAPLPPGGAPAPPPGVPGIVVGAAALPAVPEVKTETFDFADIEVYDTDLKKLDAKDVVKLLKEETTALAALGDKPDPLHLRLIKPGTLLFKLPAPKPQGAIGGIGGGIAPPGGPPE